MRKYGRLDKFMKGVDGVGFDEKVWWLALETIKESGEPARMHGLTERIIEEMMLTVVRDKKGPEVLDNYVLIVSESPFEADDKIQPFIQPSIQMIEGAASALKSMRQDDPETSVSQLVQEALEPGGDNALMSTGLLGARILRGLDTGFTYSIPHGILRNRLQGAKTCRLVILKNGLSKLF